MAASNRYSSIMVIDDDQLDLFVARKVLTREGYTDTIISVESATEGINYLRHLSGHGTSVPELILLDITMPDVNGFEFLEQYGKLGDGISKRNIIILSSTLDTAEIARAKASPYVMQFMQKPITKHLREIGRA